LLIFGIGINQADAGNAPVFFYGEIMALKNNRDSKAGSMHKVSVNVSAQHIRNEQMDGKDFIVVPVVMAIDGVVMNEALVPEEEFSPEAWNGRPVTIGHPKVNGEDVSANSPDILKEWAVGQLFNTHVEDGKLKSEAWIEVARCKALRQQGLLDTLKDQNAQLDVSTGYFCVEENTKGSSRGKEYFEIHRDLKPDHLALLPDEEGACNWADGCGVRANAFKTQALKAINAIAKALNLNLNRLEENMDEKEKAKLVDTLIGNSKDQFTECDKKALMGMSDAALKKMAEEMKPEDNEDEEDETMTNEDEEKTNEDEEEPKGNKCGEPKKNSAAALSKEDREALTFARNMIKEQRQGYIQKILAENEGMKAEELKAFDTNALKTMADISTRPAPDYSGRGMSGVRSNSEEDMAKAMAPQGVVGLIEARNKAKEEA